MTSKQAQECLNNRVKVHFDIDHREWGRVATDGEILEVLSRRRCLVHADYIRADIIVDAAELHERD